MSEDFLQNIVSQLKNKNMADKLKNKFIWIQYRYIGREMWILYYINNDGLLYNLKNGGSNYYLRFPYNREKSGDLQNTIGDIKYSGRFKHFLNLLKSDISGTLESEVYQKTKDGKDSKIRFKEMIQGKDTRSFHDLSFDMIPPPIDDKTKLPLYGPI